MGRSMSYKCPIFYLIKWFYNLFFCEPHSSVHWQILFILLLSEIEKGLKCHHMHTVISGHSTITWTKFYQILTTYPPRVYILHTVSRDQAWTTDHLPTSSCPRGYWMTPDQIQMRCCLDLSINIRNMGEGTVVGIPVKGGGFMLNLAL